MAELTEAQIIELIEDDSVPDEELEPYFEFDETPRPEVFALEDPGIPNLSTAEEGIIGAFNRRSRKRRLREYTRKKEEGFDGTVVVSEGDSWFQYPLFLKDVIDHLMDADGLNVRSLGFAGDWLSNIRMQEEYLPVLESERPSVFLISGGGNDLVGKERLKWLLPQFEPGKAPDYYLQFGVVEAIEQLRTLYTELFDRLTVEYPEMKIIGHGYDYGIPDGGRWLGKPMSKVGIVDSDLQKSIACRLIDRFNEMRIELADLYPQVVHIDCRGVVNDWKDELHPKSAGFKLVAEKILAEIRKGWS